MDHAPFEARSPSRSHPAGRVARRSACPPRDAPLIAASVLRPTWLVAEPCPLSAVLSEASKVTFLAGGDIMAMTADMSPPKLKCNYEPSTRVDEVDLTFPLVMTKGRAATSDDVQLSYFIALVNMAGEVLAKHVYQRPTSFGGKQSVIATESVENFVLTLGPGTKPTDHRILIGFQLTPDQLAYSRTRAERAAPPTPAPGATHTCAGHDSAPGTTPAPAALRARPTPTPHPRHRPGNEFAAGRTERDRGRRVRGRRPVARFRAGAGVRPARSRAVPMQRRADGRGKAKADLPPKAISGRTRAPSPKRSPRG